MEGSIIHYNHGSLVQGRQKPLGKPEFKKAAVHGSTILKRCKELIPHFSGNDPTAFISSTADSPEHLLTSRRIPVFPIQVRIDTAFIHIDKLFGRNILACFLIRCYFFRVLFLVADRLFFVLSYSAEEHPECRFRCSQTLLPSQIDMRPGVPLHTLAAFPGRFFGSSVALLSFPDSPFLSVASPILVLSIAPLRMSGAFLPAYAPPAYILLFVLYIFLNSSYSHFTISFPGFQP